MWYINKEIMELELITKILVLITCILNGLMVVLAIIWIWELLDEDVLSKLFITNSLLVMVFIILTGLSIYVSENNILL